MAFAQFPTPPCRKLNGGVPRDANLREGGRRDEQKVVSDEVGRFSAVAWLQPALTCPLPAPPRLPQSPVRRRSHFIIVHRAYEFAQSIVPIPMLLDHVLTSPPPSPPALVPLTQLNQIVVSVPYFQKSPSFSVASSLNKV